MIIIGSPVRQKPAILREFLRSLAELDTAGLDVAYCFVEDNENLESAEMVRDFVRESGVKCFLSGAQTEVPYLCDSKTHHWNNALIWRVAGHKNWILEIARAQGASVFLVDSDLVLHPQTLKTLVSRDKDIVSEIFWTSWNPGDSPLPNVWIAGQYGLSEPFLSTLRQPGCYPVGGLGACTLISESAVQAGCNFSQIPNVDYWGEDRHFCIRAEVLGLELWVDTTHPALHIYREEDLGRVEEFRRAT